MWMVPGSHKWGNQIAFLRTQGDLSLLENFKDLQGFTPPADAEIREVEARPVSGDARGGLLPPFSDLARLAL